MITKFDDYNNDKMYWIVDIEQPYFDIICWKLGVPDGRFKFINVPNVIKDNKIGKTICVEYIPQSPLKWEWDITKKNAEDIKGIKYMGHLSKEDLTDEDIMNWKIYQNSKKYNL